MSKIFSGELHRNENAAIEYGAISSSVVDAVRRTIEDLLTSRKADEYAPGAIHALRKLCDGEKESGQVYVKEVEEWKKCFFDWLTRTKKHFPPKLYDKFHKNAEDDFRAILAVANEMPEYYWRKQSKERSVQVTFKSEAALDAAREAAEEKHPVDLGSALHKYLEQQIAILVSAPAAKKNKSSPKVQDNGLTTRFTTCEDGRYSLTVDSFDCFHSDEDLEQDIVVTAYELEEAVQKYMRKHHAKIAKTVKYDSESSMFCAYSKQIAPLATIAEVLMNFSTDHDEFQQYAATGE